MYSLFVLKYFKSLLDQNTHKNIIFMCDVLFYLFKVILHFIR